MERITTIQRNISLPPGSSCGGCRGCGKTPQHCVYIGKSSVYVCDDGLSNVLLSYENTAQETLTYGNR